MGVVVVVCALNGAVWTRAHCLGRTLSLSACTRLGSITVRTVDVTAAQQCGQ